jgi:histidyl-tRNA synthetase
MAKTKASIPQGTRDFSAAVVRKRNYIFSTIKNVFELYGFAPLETPAMENLETLMGKYGEEGDKLIFRILNNRDSLKIEDLVNDFVLDKYDVDLSKYSSTDIVTIKKNKEEIKKDTKKWIKNYLSDKALRYDLTIPFARYVAMNHGQLMFPFKRYQIQPVWRADRPQRGRYREFYQCDADVVGSKSLLNEVELVNIYATVFNKLGIAVDIKINSRKILAALAELCGGTDKMVDITVAIDKLDKIGIDKVKEELSQRGLTVHQIASIEQYLQINGSNEEKLMAIKAILANVEIGEQGINEIEYLLSHQLSIVNCQLSIDFTLARGLNYYTGIVFEVKANHVQMGSIGGGGRYDDLTGLFGVPDIPGVGISFGVDRIYDVMEELQLFPETIASGTKVLFFNLGEAESRAAFGLMQTLRNKNIACEMYPEQTKFDKQFKYADKKQIPYIVIIGSKELAENNCILKNLKSGEQQTLSQIDLLALMI